MVARESWPRQTRAEHGDLRIGARVQVAVLGVGFGLAALASAAFAAPLEGATQWAEVGILLTYAAAAYATGSAFGVLFGIPRSQTQRQGSISRGTNAANTNLEQVSDWLTKIIVGVGLVQARSIADGFANVIDRLSAGLATSDGGAFVGALAVYSALVGFFTGWLLARVWLARLLSASDKTLPNEPVMPVVARPARPARVGPATSSTDPSRDGAPDAGTPTPA